MRVLSIIHAPVFSGPHNRMSIVANLLKPHGVEITVLLPEEAIVAADRLTTAGVDVVRMPLHRMRTMRDPRVHLEWAASLRREVKAVASLIRDQNIDVVATNTLPNLHGGLAARRADAACVWQLIDTFPPPIVRRVYMPIVLALADVVMTTGRKVAEAHPGTTRLGERWVNFFPCVDVQRFRADASVRSSVRAELGLPDDVTVVGNVAAISPMKGHRTFIQAAAQLRRVMPASRFVILGSSHEGRDPYYQQLWAEADQLGLKLNHDLVVVDPGARVHELAQAFDVFWMTSEPNSEGVPTAIGEAKALGLPVVTTDVGSTSECVTDGVSGYVVPPRDVHAIVEATRRILDASPDTRAAMSERSRAEAVRDFAAERGAAAHQLAFERALVHHRSTKRD